MGPSGLPDPLLLLPSLCFRLLAGSLCPWPNGLILGLISPHLIFLSGRKALFPWPFPNRMLPGSVAHCRPAIYLLNALLYYEIELPVQLSWPVRIGLNAHHVLARWDFGVGGCDRTARRSEEMRKGCWHWLEWRWEEDALPRSGRRRCRLLGLSSPLPEYARDAAKFRREGRHRRWVEMPWSPNLEGEAAARDDDIARDGLWSAQICPPYLVVDLFNGSDQPLEMSPAMGSTAAMSKMMSHCLDGDDVVGDARRWGNQAPLVTAVILPGTDRPICGSPKTLLDGNHAWLPMMVMEHHISVLRWCTEEKTFIVTLEDDDEPKLVTKALSYPTKEEWRKVMDKEIEFIRENQV
ncbi:hypothetical protein ACLOJK_035073 [Asimina triloba]